MRLRLSLVFSVLTSTLLACSGEAPDAPDAKKSGGSGDGGSGGGEGTPPGCATDAECAGSPDAPFCDVATGACVPLPPGSAIGFRDGSPGSVAFVPVYEPDKLREPTDLAFNPSKPTELWVVNRKDDSVIILQNPGAPEATAERRRDPAASHFMDKPPAIAFGVVSPEWGQRFAVCGDSDNGGNDFMGPATFPADLELFAKQTSDGLGSHLDMLHSTSFCRGIAHVEENAFFVFNSDKQSLDRYDFHGDHAPGEDDHSDGVIRRYVKGMVAGVEGVPSHLAYDPASAQLYVADTGNKRIAKLDTTSGAIGTSFSGYEPADRNNVDGAVLVDFVPPGTLEAPSGIELGGGIVYVTDSATSRFYAFDLEGALIRQLDTGLPPGSLAGFTFGPDGKIYFTDLLSGRVYRIDPR